MTVSDIYERNCATESPISAHLPRLRALAEGLPLVVEFGVQRGHSSSALLMGARRVISYDVTPTPEAEQLQAAAGDRWDYRIESSLTAEPTECAMLFVDSLHTYAQVDAELRRHAAHVVAWLVFHDSVTFGSIGADGDSGRHSWAWSVGAQVPPEHMGIRPAIDELMIRDPSWGIAAHYPDSCGLLVLNRRVP